MKMLESGGRILSLFSCEWVADIPCVRRERRERLEKKIVLPTLGNTGSDGNLVACPTFRMRGINSGMDELLAKFLVSYMIYMI